MDLTSEQKSRRAKEIIDDPVFIEMIDTARTHIVTQWNLTDFDQSAYREALYHRGRALDEVLRGLRTFVTDWAMDQSRNKKGRE